MKKTNTLVEALGLELSWQDSPNLLLALTHPSYSEVNNQRLEFLGDAVLQLAISRRLYLSHHELQEGKLTAIRQNMVCEHALATVAKQISLGDYLLMDKGCEANGGRYKESVLSDAMEAVLAAIYLDAGMEEAERVIDRLWPKNVTEMADFKGHLQEMLQAKGKKPPTYELVGEVGPAHAPQFTVRVLIDGQEYGRATETSKKRAEQAAAQQAIEQGNNWA